MFPTRRITMGGDVFRDEFSLAFDGTNDYIQLPMPINYSAVTISAWIKVTADSNAKIIVGGRDNGIDGLLFFLDSSERLILRVNGQGTSSSGMNITPNVWTHVVGTYDGDVSKTYINGVFGKEKDVSTDGITTVTTNATIGRNAFDTSNPYNGNMSEVAIYDKALSASEIKTLYNGREPYNHKEGVCSSNLQAWYRMGDGRFDQKSTNDLEGGIVTDIVTPTLGSDIFGGRGNFTDNSDNYWSLQNAGGGDNIEIADGVCKYKASGATNGFLEKTGILTVGQMYRIDVDVTLNTGASLIIDDNNPYIKICNPSETGHFTMYWRPQNQTKFRLYRHDSVGDAYDQNVNVDNVIVRPVNGNAGALQNFPKSCFKGDTP